MKESIFTGNTQSSKYPSASFLLLRVVLIIFFAEGLVMLLLPAIEEFVSIPLRALIDASLLVVFTLPLFYLILYRPVVLYIEYRQGALEKIRRSEERYRELVEFTNAVHWEAELKTLKFTYMSPQVEGMLGYPVSAWTDYQFWVDHIHPDDREWAPKYCEEHSFRGEDHELIFRMIASDGRVVWIRDTVTVYFGDSGPERVRGMMLDVTTPKMFEESLKESEEKYRMLVENANDAIFLADAETGNIIDANKKAEDLVGRELEEIMGMHQSELHPAGEAENYRKIFEESLRTGKRVFEDLFVLHKDGRRIPVEISSSVVEVRGKRFNQGIFRDVSERKKAEEDLRLLNKAVESLPVGVTIADTGGRIIYTNPAEAEMHNCKAEHLVGEEARSLAPSHLTKPLSAEEMAHFKPWLRESVNVRADGTEFPVHLASVPVLDDEGRPLGLITICEDISGRMEAEEALRTSEEKYRMIFENSPLGIQHYSEEGVCIDCNEQFAKIIGTPKEKIVDVHILGLLKDERLKSAIQASLKGEFGHYEGDYVSVLGRKETAIKADFGPILSPDGSVRGAIGVFEDISGRRQAEQEKLVFQEEAVRAAQLASVGELAAGVAHEINNPLNGIINYAQILKNRLPDKEDGEMAGLITREGDRISGIVRSLLSFTRREGGERSLVALDELLGEVFALTEMQMRKEGIHITQDIPPDLPKLHVNPQQIEQVFLNVIINARHALNERYPKTHENKTLEITGEAMTSDNKPFLRVTFLDRGTGIPAHIMEKVTRPFFTTKKKGFGTGLGLSISRNIVQSYDGTMHIESEEGICTRVIIDLPAGMSA
jgi:PAS domain S-box-containing protein